MQITQSNERTLWHGDVRIVATRGAVPQVRVENTTYSVSNARALAAELPNDAGHAGMAEKLREQADWAEGKDL